MRLTTRQRAFLRVLHAQFGADRIRNARRKVLDLFQALAEKGAEIIALPAAFTMQTGKDHWETLLRARAIETQTYVCAAAQTGSFTTGNEQRQTYGHSLVADPWGHVVAKASDGVGLVTTRVDPAVIAKVRQMIPAASHKVKIARE